MLCTSVNSEVVHGIPSPKRVLKDGDIVSVDFGVVVDGYYGDAAITVPVGSIDANAARLLKATEDSLKAGIAAVKPGATLGDVGAAVQNVIEGEGFSVVRDFVGHGIGVHMHEDPQVPNFGEAGQGMKLKVGMVIAIEPMVNAGKPDVQVLDDGWTAVASDGSMSAHFEHTVAVTATGARILTEEKHSGEQQGSAQAIPEAGFGLSKKDAIEVMGVVPETLPNAMFKVKL